MDTNYQAEFNKLYAQMINEEPAPASSPDAAMRYLAEYRDEPQESFFVLTLNTQNMVIESHKVSTGTVDRSMVHARDVFRLAILDNAKAILIAHNHPSGNCKPSREDLNMTEKLKRGGDLLGIPVVDHIIFSPYTFLSLRQDGQF